jgi:hypothetical protein
MGAVVLLTVIGVVACVCMQVHRRKGLVFPQLGNRLFAPMFPGGAATHTAPSHSSPPNNTINEKISTSYMLLKKLLVHDAWTLFKSRVKSRHEKPNINARISLTGDIIEMKDPVVDTINYSPWVSDPTEKFLPNGGPVVIAKTNTLHAATFAPKKLQDAKNPSIVKTIDVTNNAKIGAKCD